MIVVEGVSKRYKTNFGLGPWVLNDINLQIPTGTSVGFIGPNGAGKSTLLNIIAGSDIPTKGKITRNCRVSWPMGYGRGLDGRLSGKENAKFVCRINDHNQDIKKRLAFIEEFSGIGEAFHRQVNTYSTGMRARLQFAMSMAFEFDIYISDEVTSAGDAAFRKKAQDAFLERANTASVLMVSHNKNLIKNICSAGVFVYGGAATWYDDIDEAYDAYDTVMESK